MVEVAFVRDQVEAEMIRGLLEDRGIECLLQRTGVDGPSLGEGLLPQAQHRVLVGAEEAEAAKALLGALLEEHGEEPEPEAVDPGFGETESGGGPRDYNVIGAYPRGLLWSVGFFAVAFGVFMLLRVT
jgi:hypothetical protein